MSDNTLVTPLRIVVRHRPSFAVMDSLMNEELPAIVAGGSFGKNVTFVSFEQNNEMVAKDQFMSTVVFGTAITSDGSRHSLVIKLKLRDARTDHKKNYRLFHNEIVTYEKIIPFLLQCRGPTTEGDAHVPTIARYFYGRNNSGECWETDLIVLENVEPKGYRLSEERLFLDYDHLVNALQAIAKFHGLSYTAKHKDVDGFRETIADVHDVQWTDDGEWLFEGSSLYDYGRRGVDRLLERDGDRYRGREQLRRFVGLVEDGNSSLRRALRPREPLSVMCHGDFNRNNLLFRYDGRGAPADALLFDFGTPRYGSPALDLSFFLYMNTSQDTRVRRWDDLLDAYCAALAAAVAPGVRVPDRTELDAEMAASALFGLAHAAFFVPYQFENPVATEEPKKSFRPMMGGETGTEYVADMVQHFVDMGYADL